MIIKNQRLQYQRGLVDNNIFMFTANSTLNKQGKLVIGAGSARSVRDLYQGIDAQFGDVIEDKSWFGVKFVKWNSQWIGAFQTKVDWRDPSPLDLVQFSTYKLKRVADSRPQWTFHLPCPAINHGGAKVDDILPMLEILPDNVIIYVDK
jgi:hypothetical protein